MRNLIWPVGICELVNWFLTSILKNCEYFIFLTAVIIHSETIHWPQCANQGKRYLSLSWSPFRLEKCYTLKGNSRRFTEFNIRKKLGPCFSVVCIGQQTSLTLAQYLEAGEVPLKSLISIVQTVDYCLWLSGWAKIRIHWLALPEVFQILLRCVLCALRRRWKTACEI